MIDVLARLRVNINHPIYKLAFKRVSFVVNRDIVVAAHFSMFPRMSAALSMSPCCSSKADHERLISTLDGR